MKIFINTDSYNPESLKTKERLIALSIEKNFEIADDVNTSDIIVSIGGDGTFLKSARLSNEKPILGINTGTLGYLTEIKPDNLENTLNSLMNRKFNVENRMMIEGEIIKSNGEIIKIPESLNEIAVSKNISGVVRFDVCINDRLINSYTADGMLICTPTGSTAYNLSCGGPIVDPTAEILTLTPIAPHTILNRSVIISDEATVKIKITEVRANTTSHVLYDGISIQTYCGDIIKIKKSNKVTKIIKLENRSFIDNIRENIS